VKLANVPRVVADRSREIKMAEGLKFRGA